MTEEKKTAKAAGAAENPEAQTGDKQAKKKPKRDGELEKLKAELEKKEDLLMRTAAEFDNYKRRTERERISVAQYAKAEQAKKLLPILDNIDRAKNADRGTPDYLKGIEMIVKQFESLADQLELETVGEPGDTFDPNLHEAVMHVQDESYNENVIVEVLQKGYKLGDTVIRAAMVKVAN